MYPLAHCPFNTHLQLRDDGGGVTPQRVDHHRQPAEQQARLQLILQAGYCRREDLDVASKCNICKYSAIGEDGEQLQTSGSVQTGCKRTIQACSLPTRAATSSAAPLARPPNDHPAQQPRTSLRSRPAVSISAMRPASAQGGPLPFFMLRSAA